MLPQLHFTDGLPARLGCSPCLSPVWRCWPLRAAHSSSKLPFACRHLKSITLTNPLWRAPLPLVTHRELICLSEIQQDLRCNWFCTCGAANSWWEELPQHGQRLPKLPYTHRCTMSNLLHGKRTCSSLNSCCQSHRMSEQLLCQWKWRTRNR